MPPIPKPGSLVRLIDPIRVAARFSPRPGFSPPVGWIPGAVIGAGGLPVPRAALDLPALLSCRGRGSLSASGRRPLARVLVTWPAFAGEPGLWLDIDQVEALPAPALRALLRRRVSAVDFDGARDSRVVIPASGLPALLADRGLRDGAEPLPLSERAALAALLAAPHGAEPVAVLIGGLAVSRAPD